MIRFFRVRSRKEVLEELRGLPSVGEEEISIVQGTGRVTARAIHSPEDFPAFPRATMDGFAVRARDTFGASEAQPAILELIGEIRMGEEPKTPLLPGQALKIATGGMLPEGADAVVMVEHAEVIDSNILEVYRSVSPGENMVRTGEDVREGEELFPEGWTLRPQDLGLLAALGITTIKVRRRPVVAVIATGDEVIPPDRRPSPGQVRDINSVATGSWLDREGAEVVPMGIVADSAEELSVVLNSALEKADFVVISGGSSVGTRDYMMDAVERLPNVELLAHGLAIRPGKPTLVAKVGNKPLLGLPGHPVSALLILHLVGRPILDRISGRIYSHRARPVKARLSRNLASAQGREDFVRVALEERDGELWARPIIGASGLIGTLAKADGLLRIDAGCEGLYEGELVEVEIFP